MLAPPQPPRLLDQVRNACRVRHHSLRTEDAYCDGIKRFILFHNKRHPAEMDAGYDIRTVQELLGNADVSTTMMLFAQDNNGVSVSCGSVDFRVD